LAVLLASELEIPKEFTFMHRTVSLTILAAVSVLTVAGTTSSATAREPIQDTYCLQGRSSGYPGNCAFSSYQQCMATASGTYETCGVNPMKSFAQQRRSGGVYQGRY
jgi:hypothetical protein